MGNQKLPIEEGQTIQWQKEKEQTMIYKTLHRKLKMEQDKPHENIEGELVYSIRVSSSCSTCGTRRVTLNTKRVASHERGNNLILITTNGNIRSHL